MAVSFIISVSQSAFISSDFDIYAYRPIQKSVLGIIAMVYKPIAPVDQNGMKLLIISVSKT